MHLHKSQPSPTKKHTHTHKSQCTPMNDERQNNKHFSMLRQWQLFSHSHCNPKKPNRMYFWVTKVFHKNKKPPNLVATSVGQFHFLASSGSNSWFGYWYLLPRMLILKFENKFRIGTKIKNQLKIKTRNRPLARTGPKTCFRQVQVLQFFKIHLFSFSNWG